MDQPQHNNTCRDKPKYFEEIRTAIIEKQGLSFVYEREDGEVITHNAVYPRQLFRKGNRFYFRAYCYFPDDTRVLRLDKVKSLEVKPRQEHITQKQILGVVAVVLAALLAFLALLLFSTYIGGLVYSITVKPTTYLAARHT